MSILNNDNRYECICYGCLIAQNSRANKGVAMNIPNKIAEVLVGKIAKNLIQQMSDNGSTSIKVSYDSASSTGSSLEVSGSIDRLLSRFAAKKDDYVGDKSDGGNIGAKVVYNLGKFSVEGLKVEFGFDYTHGDTGDIVEDDKVTTKK